MVYLFAFSDITPPQGVAPAAHMVPIRARGAGPSAYPDSGDVLQAGAALRLLEIDAPGGAKALAGLLAEVPLYRINMEMALDAALSARHGDAALAAALEGAFAPRTLPGTLPPPPGDATHGQLRHPMLAHLSAGESAAFYAAFAGALAPGGRHAADYGFGQVLHKAPARFLEHFDGYACGGRGRAALGPLLMGARRPPDATPDAAPGDPLECYLDRALRQYHRARAVDRVMVLGVLPGAPEWVRADVRALLAWEEDRRAAARALVEAGGRPAGVDAALWGAITRDGGPGGYVSPALQKLVAQTLGDTAGRGGGAAAPYTGSGAAFAQELAAITGAGHSG
jgi:hypothetical protein